VKTQQVAFDQEKNSHELQKQLKATGNSCQPAG
jgi:hypothetical protein